MKFDNLSLSEIVTSKPQAAAVFEAFNLDYCCKGKQKLSDAISDPEKLKTIISVLEILYAEKNDTTIDFNSMNLSDLIDLILNVHHQYIKDISPVITAHLDKIALKHGDSFPYIVKIRSLFKKVIGDLINHMTKEELILFPRIKSLQGLLLEGDAVVSISVENAIRVMEKEHESAGELMAEIKALSNNYTPPETACTTHRVCLEELRMFESDLHKHVHLENNILFPKAIELEHRLEIKK